MKNTFLKRTLVLLLMLVLGSTLMGTFAFADVIYTPDDDFYNSHYEEFEYLNRNYYTNGEEGYVEFFKEPDGSSAGFSKNGNSFLILSTYKGAGGVLWGVTEYDDTSSADKYLLPAEGNGSLIVGYVKMDDMVLGYDSQRFLEEHASELKPYEGDSTALADLESAVFWTYPHSGEYYEYTLEFEDRPAFDEAYTDDDGRVWGYVSYYYGIKDSWVCISDPLATDIETIEYQKIDFIQPDSDTPPTPSRDGLSTTTIAIILVAAVVIVSLILIIVLRKKKTGAEQ